MIYFLFYLVVVFLEMFSRTYSIILNIMISLYGVLLIIFRKEAIIILNEQKKRFKAKYSRLGKYYNPLISQPIIIFIGVFFFLFPFFIFVTRK